MKKIILTTMAIATMLVALVGCGKCEHTFSEATCQTLATCTQCGETTGELAEHKWVEATCQAPKTCTVCGMTEGDVAAHDFAPATLLAPKTCYVCGATEGEPLSLSIVDYEYNMDAYVGQNLWGMSMRDRTVGYLWDMDRDAVVFYEFNDVNGNVTNELYLPESEGVFTYAMIDHADIFCTTCVVWSDDGEPGFCIIIADADGNEIYRHDYYDWGWTPDEVVDLWFADKFYLLAESSMKGNGFIEFYDGNDTLRCAYDMKNNTLVDAADYERAACPISDEYELEMYDYINNLIIASKNEQYCLFDQSGNLLKDGMDDYAGFNSDGYALVSTNGRETYDLIDLKGQVVVKDAITGCENSYTRGGKYFLNRYDGVDIIQELVIE